MIKKIILTFIISSNVYGAHIKITANEAVQMALKNSLDSQNAEYKEKIKELYKSNAWNILFPDLSLGLGISRSNSVQSVPGYSITERDNWGFNFNASAKLLISPSVAKNIEFAVLDYENAKIDKEKAVNTIKISVLKAYNQLIALKNTVEVYESQLKNSRLKSEQAAIAYRNGLMAEVDYLDARLNYDRAKPELEVQRIVFENSKEVFKILIGISVDDDIEAVGELAVEKIDKSLLEEEINILSLSEIKSLKNNSKMTEVTKDSIWLNTFFPNFGLSFSYSPSRSFGDSRGGFQDSGALSFSLSYNLSNLFPWSKSYTQLQEKEYELKILINQIEKKIQETKSEIVQRKKDIERFKAILEASKLNVELAKRTYTLAFKAFNSGTIDLSRLNDIELSYKSSELQLIKDKLEYSNAILVYKNLINALD